LTQLSTAAPLQTISIIVPAFNAAGTLGECLTALLRQTAPRGSYEIIVVDDGSLDATADVARRYCDEGVRLVRQQNQGAAGARNSGVAQAVGELLLFTDSDCAPQPDWIERMAGAFGDPDTVGAKGTYLTRQRRLVARFVQIEYEDRYDRMRNQERIDFIDTYSAGYRRNIFLQNGGFDVAVRYVEDQEFSFRLAEKGYKLVFVPEARVSHQHDQDVFEYVERKFNIGVWKARVMQRHPDRLASDTHTPPALKLQILLMFLSLPLLLIGLALAMLGSIGWQVVFGAGVAGVLAFLASSLPFLLKAWRKDPAVALVAPLLLAARALALGAGYGVGLLRFLHVEPQERPVLRARQRLVKRLVDLIGAALSFTVTAPLSLAIAVAVKLDSPGPALFIQDRVGTNGRTFRLLKFRTMVQGADKQLGDLIDLGSLEEPAFKLKDDPRVTRVGRFLRRFSLDELPQFLNVLRGDMSLVGPRPEEAWLVRQYNDHQRRRLAVRPGMTGPMQVNGRGDLTFAQRLDLELDYIEHYSLRRDIAILLKTIPVVLKGSGAY
jgi:lipopolysaccharide/colanic/teichoic acid biosynthesis glycosyltransferase/glycosyltransferase involved in cell wall biosynthesis